MKRYGKNKERREKKSAMDWATAVAFASASKTFGSNRSSHEHSGSDISDADARNPPTSSRMRPSCRRRSKEVLHKSKGEIGNVRRARSLGYGKGRGSGQNRGRGRRSRGRRSRGRGSGRRRSRGSSRKERSQTLLSETLSSTEERGLEQTSSMFDLKSNRRVTVHKPLPPALKPHLAPSPYSQPKTTFKSAPESNSKPIPPKIARYNLHSTIASQPERYHQRRLQPQTRPQAHASLRSVKFPLSENSSAYRGFDTDSEGCIDGSFSHPPSAKVTGLSREESLRLQNQSLIRRLQHMSLENQKVKKEFQGLFQQLCVARSLAKRRPKPGLKFPFERTKAQIQASHRFEYLDHLNVIKDITNRMQKKFDMEIEVFEKKSSEKLNRNRDKVGKLEASVEEVKRRRTSARLRENDLRVKISQEKTALDGERVANKEHIQSLKNALKDAVGARDATAADHQKLSTELHQEQHLRRQADDQLKQTQATLQDFERKMRAKKQHYQENIKLIHQQSKKAISTIKQGLRDCIITKLRAHSSRHSITEEPHKMPKLS